jgi:hypothetical protein
LALPFDRGLWVVAGIAIGGAAEDVLVPILEPARQGAWAARPWKVLDPSLAAAVRARNHQDNYGGIPLRNVDLEDDIRRNGVGSARAELLTDLQRTWPSVAELLALRRRNLALGGDAGIGRDAFRDGLRRQGFTTAAIDELTKLLVEYLGVADIANAIQQGFVPGDGILPPASPPRPNWTTSDGPIDVPVEEVNIDPEAEAGVHGIDRARLKVLAELVGLPPGEETLIDLWRRRIIDAQTYQAGLREGHTKTKWTAALSARYWQLLPPSVLVNLHLRGYITDGDFKNRMSLHGYRAEAAEDWFLSAGRPLAPQQMLDLIARKGPSPDGSGPFTFADFRQGMVESDIKPKYATPAQALYHKYPPLFQLRRAVEGGGMTKTRARAIMEIERYEEQDINSLLASWTEAAPSSDPYVGKARSQLWSALHRSYISEALEDPAAELGFSQLGIPQAEWATILGLWQHERALVTKRLTPAQVKKAYAKGVTNTATGAAWTRADAVAYLEELGYDVDDINTYLDE